MSGQTKTLQLKDFAKELGDFSNRSLKEQRQAVARGFAKSIPDLVAASPVDTGLYAASWDFTVGEESAIIGNYAPYAGVIEYGARPFTPPIAPLLAWAKRVLTGQKDDHGKLIQTGQPETDYTPEVWALAKATQHKISEQGMQPRHVMTNMIPKIIENIREELIRGK